MFAPKEEITFLSSSDALRKFEFPMSKQYTVKVQQAKLLSKTKYYTKKTVDITELKKMLS